jgi:hypothetical protein
MPRPKKDEQPHQDNKKFMLDTPEHVADALTRSWDQLPAELIAHDICEFQRTQQRIIDADGCVVPDLNTRRGRRRYPRTYKLHSDCTGSEEVCTHRHKEWLRKAGMNL